MYKLIIALGVVLCFASCQEEEKKAKPVPIISFYKAKKLLNTYTGKQDTVMYLHRGYVRLDSTVGQNILISERVSDPHPLVSVYFIKADTLIFIPVSAVSGTMPEVEELELELEDKRQLGVWYTRKEKGNTYSYRIALYHFSGGRLICLLDEPLYHISSTGKLEAVKLMELGKWKDNTPREVYLVEAEVNAQRAQGNLNNGPLLMKKKQGKRQLFKYDADLQKYLSDTAQVKG